MQQMLVRIVQELSICCFWLMQIGAHMHSNPADIMQQLQMSNPPWFLMLLLYHQRPVNHFKIAESAASALLLLADTNNDWSMAAALCSAEREPVGMPVLSL